MELLDYLICAYCRIPSGYIQPDGFREIRIAGPVAMLPRGHLSQASFIERYQYGNTDVVEYH